MALYQSKPGLIDEIIWSGTLKMRQIAAETIREARAKMGIDRVWESLRRNANKQ
jgi:tryptophanyl-tRNA synthetase